MVVLYVICGHGAGDPGACGNGYQEAERVRTLGKRIKELGGNSVVLGDMNRNFYKDNGISRLNLSKEYQIIELHMDSGASAAKGAHVIIKAGFDADKYDHALADFLGGMFPGRAKRIAGRGDLANPNRAAAKGYSYRLVECGFISNAGDVAIFNANIDKIARGILECFGIAAQNGNTNTGNVQKPAPSQQSGGGYTGNSIVDYLNSIGKDSSLAARKKYAAQYGITGYTGTASQNLGLLNKMRAGSNPTAQEPSVYYNKYTGNSARVDEVLAAVGVPVAYCGSWMKRRTVATKNGIAAYVGTATQNNKLISLAKVGKLKRV